MVSVPRLVQHPAFDKAGAALMRALDSAAPGQIIFVIGLSGSGKSELRQEAMWKYAGRPEAWGVGKLPVLSVRATPSDKSYFSPKEFMGRLLLSVNEPNLEWLRRAQDSRATPDTIHLELESKLSSDLWHQLSRSRSEMAMRAVFERTARARSLRAIFIEEAASITHVHGNQLPGDHMVNYMCLAEEVGVALVLFGVPRVNALWQGNAEIRRRSKFVYVRRYRSDTAEDRRNFARLLVTLSRRYEFADSKLVVRTASRTYHATAGVFGEVKGYFERADEARLDAGASAIDDAHLAQAIYPESELDTLHQDAALFDRLVTPASCTS